MDVTYCRPHVRFFGRYIGRASGPMVVGESIWGNGGEDDDVGVAELDLWDVE